MPTIAIDVLGGAHAPRASIEAAAAATRLRDVPDLDVILVGPESTTRALLRDVAYDGARLDLVDAPNDPTATLESAITLVSAGQADALVTAGYPPTALRACARQFALLPGVRRAPLAAVVPTAPRPGNRDPFALLLDVGATVRGTTDDYVTWARLGLAYASRISGVEAPTVGLLANASEPDSGPVELAQAHRLLAADSSLRFVGNVLGIDVPRGAADVIVCDGFVGQIVVGLLGGIGDALVGAARDAWQQSLSWRMGLRLLEGAVVKFREVTDHRFYGGAPLLGFDRLAILALPTSEAPSLTNALKVAGKACRRDVVGALRSAAAPR